jgi:hypothetical protein
MDRFAVDIEGRAVDGARPSIRPAAFCIGLSYAMKKLLAFACGAGLGSIGELGCAVTAVSCCICGVCPGREAVVVTTN